MKFCAYIACLFFVIAAVGHLSAKSFGGAFECVGLAWLSLWALEAR